MPLVGGFGPGTGRFKVPKSSCRMASASSSRQAWYLPDGAPA